MAVTAPPRRSEPEGPAERVGRQLTVAHAATGAVGVGLAFIVARDGSPAWQLVRLVVVVGVVGVTAALLRHRRSMVGSLAALGLSLIAVPVGVGIGGPFRHVPAGDPRRAAGHDRHRVGRTRANSMTRSWSTSRSEES